MVRLKNRYLLLEILYPEPSKPDLRSHSHLQIHSPTPSLTAGALAKLIRDEVSDLYGDWGVGRLGGGGISGTLPSPFPLAFFVSQRLPFFQVVT